MDEQIIEAQRFFRLRAGGVECDGSGLRVAGIELLDRRSISASRTDFESRK